MTTGTRSALSVVVLAIFASCQTYDFEPVTPLAIAQTTQSKTVTAKQLKPDMMILLDKSGSMSAALPNGTGCAGCMYPGCPEATCPTRMGALKAAMNTFLMSSGRVARMGLTKYPADGTCGAAGPQEQLVTISPASDSDADLQAHANGINMQIQSPALTPNGGTPTGNSLAFVGTIAELNVADREDFILLLTDGLPNCNAMNPNVCTMPASCQCTINGGMCGSMVNDADPVNFCRRGCLDQDGAVQAIRDLRARSIRTIVVGFGSDFATAGGGFNVLNAMAVAGGFQRTCPMGTNAECGMGGNCLTPANVCERAFYSAGTAAELAAALAQISDNLAGDSICTFTLEAQPTSADLLSVLIDGQATTSGSDTWVLQAGKLIFQGALCDRFKASTSSNPVKVEIRIVQAL